MVSLPIFVVSPLHRDIHYNDESNSLYNISSKLNGFQEVSCMYASMPTQIGGLYRRTFDLYMALSIDKELDGSRMIAKQCQSIELDKAEISQRLTVTIDPYFTLVSAVITPFKRVLLSPTRLNQSGVLSLHVLLHHSVDLS